MITNYIELLSTNKFKRVFVREYQRFRKGQLELVRAHFRKWPERLIAH